jgi:hypothetical protein
MRFLGVEDDKERDSARRRGAKGQTPEETGSSNGIAMKWQLKRRKP